MDRYSPTSADLRESLARAQRQRDQARREREVLISAVRVLAWVAVGLLAALVAAALT